MSDVYDIVVIGSGPGGATLTYALADSGAKVLLIERGDFLPSEPQNWDLQARTERRYLTRESCLNAANKVFDDFGCYCVGGQTKFYGSALVRRRREDFEDVVYDEGISPAWPIGYEDLEPYYQRAEEIYLVHGNAGEDPTEPVRSKPYPYPALDYSPDTARFIAAIREQGLHPFHTPVGIDYRASGKCILCQTCDGFPCRLHGKGDADVQCVRPALERSNVELWTRSFVRSLRTDPTGRRVVEAEVECDGELRRVTAGVFVVSAGALNSPALLLRSASDANPHGLANSSGLVGRNLMMKNATFICAIDPALKHETPFHKTWGIHDFYFGSERSLFPSGLLQAMGKTAFPPFVFGMTDAELDSVMNQSQFVMALVECLPERDNHVTNIDGKLKIHFRENNLKSMNRLVEIARDLLRGAGFQTLKLFEPRVGPLETATYILQGHINGTTRMGVDPALSVVDRNCRAHDVDNLYVVDGSFFPSQGSVGPALTIAANALRVADHLMGLGR